MKFKFCGNIDCPEWLISEITFLTKLTTIKLRIISNNLINYILTNSNNINNITNILEEMNFSENESHIIISLLEFIIKNAAKFDVEDLVLNQELQQLGLPLENADCISKVYKNQKENLKNRLKNDIFTFNKIKSVDYKISYVLANNFNDYNIKTIPNYEFTFDTNEEDSKENYQITNLDAKINICLNTINNNKEDVFHITTNKEILGKLINDLSKCSEQLKKYKEQ